MYLFSRHSGFPFQIFFFFSLWIPRSPGHNHFGQQQRHLYLISSDPRCLRRHRQLSQFCLPPAWAHLDDRTEHETTEMCVRLWMTASFPERAKRDHFSRIRDGVYTRARGGVLGCSFGIRRLGLAPLSLLLFSLFFSYIGPAEAESVSRQQGTTSIWSGASVAVQEFRCDGTHTHKHTIRHLFLGLNIPPPCDAQKKTSSMRIGMPRPAARAG